MINVKQYTTKLVLIVVLCPIINVNRVKHMNVEIEICMEDNILEDFNIEIGDLMNIPVECDDSSETQTGVSETIGDILAEINWTIEELENVADTNNTESFGGTGSNTNQYGTKRVPQNICGDSVHEKGELKSFNEDGTKRILQNICGDSVHEQDELESFNEDGTERVPQNICGNSVHEHDQLNSLNEDGTERVPQNICEDTSFLIELRISSKFCVVHS